MLEYLRNAAEKPVAKILIGILAFSFVGWGVAEWVFGGSMGDNSLVKVGSEKITLNQYNQARAQEMAKLTREQQRAVYTDAAKGAEFSNQIMARLTTETMAENRADDLGFVVTNARVAREIREFPEFQINGQFSSYLFDNILANSGYSEADFAHFLRAQVLRSMVLGGLNVPVPVSDFAVTAAYNARYGQREIEFATVKYSDFTVGTPTEENLREFYAANPHVVEETRQVSYVLIPAEMDKPDSYDAALERAQRVEDEIIGGETLAAAAAHHGAKYVSLGEFARDSRPVDTVLTDSMVAKIFDMDEGVESELTETKKGFVIARVDKVTPRHNAEFDKVRGRLGADWKKAEQRKQAYLKANEMLSSVKAGDALAGAKNVTVSRTAGAPLKVLVAAFGTNVGDNGIIEDDDAFYVMRVRNEIAPKADAAKKAALRKELETMSMRTVADDYNSFLIREYPVKVNKKVYDKVFAQ